MTAWGRHTFFAAVLMLAVGCASVLPKKAISDPSGINGTWRGKGSSAEMVEWRIMGDRYEAIVQDKTAGRTLNTSGTLRRDGDRVAFRSKDATGTVTLRELFGQRRLKIVGKNQTTGRDFSADLAPVR
jgi:hypothetical protein